MAGRFRPRAFLGVIKVRRRRRPASNPERQAVHEKRAAGRPSRGHYATQALRRAPVHVTLLDRRNIHLFQPPLYQVTTGGLSPANNATPLRNILKRHQDVRVLLGEAVGLELFHIFPRFTQVSILWRGAGRERTVGSEWIQRH
jgi:hypothetical protein